MENAFQWALLQKYSAKIGTCTQKEQNIAEKILKNIFLEKKLLKIFKCAVCVQNKKKWDNLFTKIVWYLKNDFCDHFYAYIRSLKKIDFLASNGQLATFSLAWKVVWLSKRECLKWTIFFWFLKYSVNIPTSDGLYWVLKFFVLQKE